MEYSIMNTQKPVNNNSIEQQQQQAKKNLLSLVISFAGLSFILHPSIFSVERSTRSFKTVYYASFSWFCFALRFSAAAFQLQRKIPFLSNAAYWHCHHTAHIESFNQQFAFQMSQAFSIFSSVSRVFYSSLAKAM